MMSMNWSRPQRRKVDGALQAHPVESGRCRDAAVSVLPVARCVDVDAVALQITPIAPAPKIKRCGPGETWFYHVVVQAAGHRVDAMTGSDGEPCADYLERYFEYADQLSEAVVKLPPPQRRKRNSRG